MWKKKFLQGDGLGRAGGDNLPLFGDFVRRLMERKFL